MHMTLMGWCIIKPELMIIMDYKMMQHILFQGYSTPDFEL